MYINGSTKEIVYSDSNFKNQIGYLNPKESADYMGTFDKAALIVYKVDGSNVKKAGFVKWLGGIK